MTPKIQGALALAVAVGFLAGCSRHEQPQQPTQRGNNAAPDAQAQAVTPTLKSGTKVVVGNQVAIVTGHDDVQCGGPVEYSTCKVVKIVPGGHTVTLVGQDAQGRTVQWDEVWQIVPVSTSTGNRFQIHRQDGSLVLPASLLPKQQQQ
jgi:hypothetical protein